MFDNNSYNRVHALIQDSLNSILCFIGTSGQLKCNQSVGWRQNFVHFGLSTYHEELALIFYHTTLLVLMRSENLFLQIDKKSFL